MKGSRKRKDKKQTQILRAVYFSIILIGAILVVTAVLEKFYLLRLISQNTLDFVGDAAISFCFPASALIYLKLFDKRKKSMASKLGLTKANLNLDNIFIGISIFLVIIGLELGLGYVSVVTGTQINTNVDIELAGAPIWFYVFASILSPINEEILFRGLMVPRIGIVLSAIIFALGHLSYMSTSYVPTLNVQIAAGVVAVVCIAYSLVKLRSWQYALTILIIAVLFIYGVLGVEVVAAFIFGLIAGYVYKRTNSLYPSIIAHMLVNSLAIVTTFALLI